jgi:7,8-dihydroneopterin aldolase/epimerase/oxygenase
VSDATPKGKNYRIFIRDLEMIASVGVYEFEKVRPQRIRVSIDLNVGPRAPDATDTADTVLSYENIVKATRAIVATGHFHLIETLAEKIAAECLHHYTVGSVKVKIEKPDIFPDAATVGIEIERP